jgi:hypothetical protein
MQVADARAFDARHRVRRQHERNPETRPLALDEREERAMVWPPHELEALVELCAGQLAGECGLAVGGRPPHETVVHAHPRVGPLDDLAVDVALGAVDVPGSAAGDDARSLDGRLTIESVDVEVGVAAESARRRREGLQERRRQLQSRVRNLDDDGRLGSGWFDELERCTHPRAK